MRRRTGLFRLAITITLSVAMPVCCCEGRMALARLLAAVLPAHVDETAGACCGGAGARAPGGDDAGEPHDRSTCHCVDQPKSLVPADAGVPIASSVIAVVDWMARPSVGEWRASAPSGLRAPYRPPTSLLALHCALRT